MNAELRGEDKAFCERALCHPKISLELPPAYDPHAVGVAPPSH
jgi:hypothetical protein